MFLSSVGAPFLRPGLQSHRALVAAAVKGSAQPRAAASLRRALDLEWAAATGATLDQAGCVRTSASASHNPYSASGSGSGKPIKKRDHNSINCRDPAHLVAK